MKYQKLIAGVGEAIHTEYGLDGSGADSRREVPKYLRSISVAVNDYIPFNRDVNNSYYSLYSGIRWRGEAAIFRGTRPNGSGHAWLIDGVVFIQDENNIGNQADYFHCNWGWGGTHNGYYLTIVYKATGGASADNADNSPYKTTDIAFCHPVLFDY